MAVQAVGDDRSIEIQRTQRYARARATTRWPSRSADFALTTAPLISREWWARVSCRRMTRSTTSCPEMSSVEIVQAPRPIES